MYKNQLQELAQRSCFNLPSYACIKEGPNHAPRFKASVNFNGEIFESQTYCNTLRQAEHSAAEFALNVLSSRVPSRSLTARVLDETGIYKNLLQETAHRAGLKLPVYTTVRSGPGHLPTFTCTVQIAGICFSGNSAKTKKQAEKNAAIAAWSALNRMPTLEVLKNGSRAVVESKEELETKKKMNNQIPSSSSSSSSLNNNKDVEKWKLVDLIMDLRQESSSQQKHINFASLVPPPPPRTTSKILPPPQQSRSSSSQLDHNLKDQKEWVGHNVVIPRSGHQCHNHNKESPQTLLYKPPHHFGRHVHPHKIAPAVQIRSVIPVCSAPPSKSPPPTTTIISSSHQKEGSEQPVPKFGSEAYKETKQ